MKPSFNSKTALHVHPCDVRANGVLYSRLLVPTSCYYCCTTEYALLYRLCDVLCALTVGLKLHPFVAHLSAVLYKHIYSQYSTAGHTVLPPVRTYSEIADNCGGKGRQIPLKKLGIGSSIFSTPPWSRNAAGEQQEMKGRFGANKSSGLLE